MQFKVIKITYRPSKSHNPHCNIIEALVKSNTRNFLFTFYQSLTDYDRWGHEIYFGSNYLNEEKNNTSRSFNYRRGIKMPQKYNKLAEYLKDMLPNLIEKFGNESTVIDCDKQPVYL